MLETFACKGIGSSIAALLHYKSVDTPVRALEAFLWPPLILQQRVCFPIVFRLRIPTSNGNCECLDYVRTIG